MSDKYNPPPGPPPGRATNSHAFGGLNDEGSSQQHSRNPFRRAHKQSVPDRDAPPVYEAPPGGSPSWIDEKKQAASRGYQASPTAPIEEDYAPPPGPPPGRSSAQEEYAAPPGPPSPHNKDDPEPPPYDPWLAVPNSTLLPPPPSISEKFSPTANADYDDAAKGQAWCRQNPLRRPRQQNQQTLRRIANGAIQLTAPPQANRAVTIRQLAHGQTHIRTSPKCTDSIFLSDLPVYTASNQSPTIIYFEIKVLSMGNTNRRGEADAGIALGFLAPPYPSWRLPGWERASLGVHGDDGRRYVDNAYGGQEFTQPFRAGDVVGIGMKFSPPLYQGGRKSVKVFFTRNGKPSGDWDLHEERDSAEDGGDVTGLEGEHDILAAAGCFGGVEFETRFRKDLWMYRV